MHRNTFIIVSLLAVAAALIVGVNMGRKINSDTQPILPTDTPGVPSATPAPKNIFYQSKECGISFSYPPNLTEVTSPQGGVFVNKDNPEDSVAVACQADIPRPALLPERIETVTIGSVSAKLYHDASEKDGTQVDKLIFTHPAKKIDVYLSGYGIPFQTILNSLKLL